MIIIIYNHIINLTAAHQTGAAYLWGILDARLPLLNAPLPIFADIFLQFLPFSVSDLSFSVNPISCQKCKPLELPFTVSIGNSCKVTSLSLFCVLFVLFCYSNIVTFLRAKIHNFAIEYSILYFSKALRQRAKTLKL